jgi:hypothetical protein
MNADRKVEAMFLRGIFFLILVATWLLATKVLGCEAPKKSEPVGKGEISTSAWTESVSVPF